MKRPQFTFEDLIYPMTARVFDETVKGKKPFVFKGNSFKKHFFENIVTWEQFSNYIANDRAVSGLQVVTPEGKKLCMEKGNLYTNTKPSWSKQDRYEKKYVYELWQKGSSIILPKASMFSPNISAIGNAIEAKYLGVSAADAHFYCSPRKDARSFDCHSDTDDNFLVHAIGEVRWQVYNIRNKLEISELGIRKQIGKPARSEEELKNETPIIDEVLTVGDVLYIPGGFFHKATPQTARISISVPILESRKEYPIDRNYYDFGKNIS